jgi:hypothetical protein
MRDGFILDSPSGPAGVPQCTRTGRKPTGRPVDSARTGRNPDSEMTVRRGRSATLSDRGECPIGLNRLNLRQRRFGSNGTIEVVRVLWQRQPVSALANSELLFGRLWRACVRACACECVRVRACMRACVRACVRVCVGRVGRVYGACAREPPASSSTHSSTQSTFGLLPSGEALASGAVTGCNTAATTFFRISFSGSSCGPEEPRVSAYAWCQQQSPCAFWFRSAPEPHARVPQSPRASCQPHGKLQPMPLSDACVDA